MSQQKSQTYVTRLVAYSMANYQYHIVHINVENKLALLADNTAPGYILDNKPDNDMEKAGRIVISGTAKCKLGGNVNIGDKIIPDASGHGVAYSKPGAYSASWEHIVGEALEDGVSGDIIEIDVQPDAW